MAMFVMSANTGAAVGSQLLRKGDAPTYHIGFRACVGLVSFGLAVAIFQHVQYRWSNKKIEEKHAAQGETRDDGLEVRRFVL